tara:strand:- start:1619 stop:2920 length:1302 start_codon:yes stop_codon:yes gene_type:complete
MSTPYTTIAFHTLGCKLNFSETSTIARDFSKRGFKRVSFKDHADIYILNSCSVTENADKEARKLIRRSKKKNPLSMFALIGCYAQLKPDEISKIGGVDLILGAEEKFNLFDHLAALNNFKDTVVKHSSIDKVKHFHPSYSEVERTRSFLKVQDGCNYTCSFCTIPLARGGSRNSSIGKTLGVAKKVAKSKSREIVLTGVNIGDFKSDKNENFYDLIKQLDNVKDIDRFRISSIEPNLLTNEIIDFCYNSKKFMPHFHIPLQSGSNKILKLMRRRYDRDLFKNRVEKIKSTWPDACIGVDAIVGFPNESEQDFIATYDLLKSLEISYLHVFTYSERANTDAIKIPNLIGKTIKIQRSKILRNLSQKLLILFQENYIGKSRKVLFESTKNGKIVGHSDNYIEVEVDGNVDLINTIQNVKFLNQKNSIVFGKILYL